MSDAAELKPDLNEARRFLDTLERDGRFCFQTFDDSKEKRGHLARILNGTLEEHAADLERLNQAGAGVFVTINRTDGGGRKGSNVTAVRALFIDGDGIPLPGTTSTTENTEGTENENGGAGWHAIPDLIVQRDETHWHAYWLSSDCALDVFAAAQKRLIAFYGSDGVIHDLPRVMRLPGFWHRKAAPCRVYVATQRMGSIRTLESLLQGLPELPVSSAVGGGAAFSRAPVSPTAGGRKDRAGAGPLTEVERAERYALSFLGGVRPRGGGWNNALKDLVTNLCSNFKCDDDQIRAVALNWSRSVRDHDAGKEAEALRTIQSMLDFCTRGGLRGNKWRPMLEARAPSWDGRETRIDVSETESSTTTTEGAGASAAAGEEPAALVDSPDDDDAREPGTLLPKLPAIPEGDVAAWFDKNFEEQLYNIRSLAGTKRDAAVRDLLREIAARSVGLSVITKARVKEQFCAVLDFGRRDFDKALDETAVAACPEGGAGGFMAIAREFCDCLRDDGKAWVYWLEDWYQWTRGTGCYRRQGKRWIESQVALWLAGRGVDPTTGVMGDFFVSLRAQCILHDDVKAGTWIEEDAARNSDGAIYLSMRNGILNLCDRAKPLLPHTPNFFTLHAAPFAFDANAVCPIWKATVDRWHPVDGGPDGNLNAAHVVLQDWMGYLHVPFNPHKRFMVNVGPGNDGKSIYSGVCREVIGVRNCAAVGLEQFDPTKQFGLTPLLGTMLNIIGDANQIEKVAEGTLKSLTGNDVYTFDRKNRDPVTEVWPGKIMINANEVPNWRGRSEALYNRMLPLFWNPIPAGQINTNLMDELRGELSGIFNWAMDGFDRIRKRSFEVKDNVQAWVEVTREETQHELAFFDQSIEIDTALLNSTQKMYPEELVEGYVIFCKSINVKAFCHANTLGKQLRNWVHRRLVSDGVEGERVADFLAKFFVRENRQSDRPRLRFYRGLKLLREEGEQGLPYTA